MLNQIEHYVSQLPDSEKILIINGYEQLTRDGFIGDEPIRKHAEQLMVKMGTHGNVPLWMTQLAFESYRYYGKLYIDLEEAAFAK